jgi:hypothetical protein
MAHWWNYVDGSKPKYSEENLSKSHFSHHKSHMYRLGIETWLCGEKRAANIPSHGATNNVDPAPHNIKFLSSCFS